MSDATPPKHLKLIGCEIVYREVCHLVARSPNLVDVEFLPKGLHDIETERMRARLQERIDAVPADRYEAILLAYARCNDGLVDVRARDLPLVLPRAHDCVTLFFGDRHRYREYFDAHPGTYYYTSGWFERNRATEEGGVMKQLGLGRSYEQYVAEYGEENAKFIMEMTGGWTANYTQITYIDMGVAEHLGYRDRARQLAHERGWTFDPVTGDLGLLSRLINGPWDPQEFLIVTPTRRITARNDHYVLGVE
jgi:hypothetical protein